MTTDRNRSGAPARDRRPLLAIGAGAVLLVLSAWFFYGRRGDAGPAVEGSGPARPAVAETGAVAPLSPTDAGADLTAAAAGPVGLRVSTSPGVRLAGDGVLEGRVVDIERAEGVGGATVDLLALPPLVGIEVQRFMELGSFRDDVVRRMAPIATTVSASDGGFAFAGVRRGRYFLSARGDYHVPHAAVTARVVPSGAGGPVEVPVRAGGAVTGVVLDVSERPAPGANVALYQGPTAVLDALRRGDAALLETRADRDGRFTLVGVPPGDGYDLSAWSDSLTLSHRTGVSVFAGEATEVVLRARAGAEVRGLVVARAGEDENAGLEPVPGALVGAVPRGLRDLTFVAAVLQRTASKADADGRFRLEGVPPGEVDIVAWAPRHLPVHRAGIAVAPGGSADAGELVLGTGPILRGRVVDSEGQPLADVRMRWDLVDWRSLDLDFSFAPFLYQALDEFLFPTTDADGRFEAGPFAGRPRHDLWLFAPGFGWKRHRWDPEADGDEVEIVLQRGGAVEGIVLDADAIEPVTSFTIEAAGRVEEAFDAPSPLNPFSGGAEIEHPQGRFRIDGLRPGDGRFVVSAEGYRSETVSDLTIVEGETRKGVIVKLKRGLSITGTVVDAEGAAVVGAVVVPFDDRGRALSGPRREALEDTPLEGLDDLRRIAPVDIAGGLGVFATGSDVSDSAGRFELHGLAPGTVELTALHRGHAPSTSEPVTLSEDGEVPDIVIELEAGGAIEGTVTDLRGDPVPGVGIYAARPPSRDSGGRTGIYQGSTDGEGRYRIDNVPAGSFFVAMMRGDEALDPLSFLGSLGFDLVTVPRSGTVRLDLVDRSAAATRVWGVVRSGGAPVDGGGLLAFDFEGDNLLGIDLKITRVDAAGRYEFPGLAPGSYRFLYQSGRGETSLEVEIPERPEFRLDVELPSGRIEGTVVDAASGEVIGRADVVARRSGASSGQGLLGALLARESRDERERADDRGRFEFDSLEPGTYSLVARGPRWGEGVGRWAPSEPLEVTLAAGESLRSLRFELEPSLGVEGRVVDEFGAPVAGAQVRVIPADQVVGADRGGESGEDGRFAVTGLAPGPVDVTAEADGFAPARVEDLELERGVPTDLELVVTRGTELRVRAYVEGRPAAGALGRVERVGSADVERTRAARDLFRGVLEGQGVAGADGILDFGRLAPGRYRIQVSRGSLKAVLDEVDVDGQAPLTLRVDLR